MPSNPRIIDGKVARLGAERPLHFAAADPAQDLPAHVRAGSGLCRWGAHRVVAQDDVNALALVEVETGIATSLLLPAGPDGRRHFSEGLGNKRAKMDLEACLVLPDGRLLVLGSGSTPARERLVVVDAAHEVRVVDAGAFYAHLRDRPDFAGAELNIEGAVVLDGRLRLFQRGNGAAVGGLAATNAIGDLRLEDFLKWLDHDGPPPQLVSVMRVDLGDIGGVPLGFTDATALPDGRIVFLAGAEDSPDVYRDGAVLGARIGLIDGDRIVVAAVVDAAGESTRLKLEGVDFDGFSEAGAMAFTVVADMDDPDVPTVMATLEWAPL